MALRRAGLPGRARAGCVSGLPAQIRRTIECETGIPVVNAVKGHAGAGSDTTFGVSDTRGYVKIRSLYGLSALMPLDQLRAASDHFKATLHSDPAVTGSGEFEIRRFDLTAGRAKGLVVTLARSQFLDNKVQITMEYLPPRK